MPPPITAADLEQNAVLAALPMADRERVAARLQPYLLKHEIVTEVGMPFRYAYFPTSGLISIVAELRRGAEVEVGTVGHEGMAGLPLFLGSNVSDYRVVSQIAGAGFRMPASRLAAEIAASDALREALLRYTELRLVMLGQTAACNRAHEMGARIARWLLICHDSVAGDGFALTQEFLAQMLGTRRPTVTVAAAALQRAGVITYRRGAVTILDRSALEDAACECYATVVAAKKRLMSSPRPVAREKRRAERVLPHAIDGPIAAIRPAASGRAAPLDRAGTGTRV